MSMTAAVLLGSAACYALKLVGYVVPGHWLDGERVRRVTGALPVALLAALVGVQTFAGVGGRIGADARLWGVLAALVLLRLRAGFIVVVLGAALVAGVLRALGWAA